jgi:hypothetical protein
MSRIFPDRFNVACPQHRAKSHICRLFDIYGEIGLNSKQPKEKIVQDIQTIFFDWMKRKTFIPKEAYEGKNFTIKSHLGLPPAEGIVLDNFWAVQFVDEDSALPHRKWITELYFRLSYSPSENVRPAILRNSLCIARR